MSIDVVPQANHPPAWSYARPILYGLTILVVGLGPWMALARLNLQWRPEVPWAAVAIAFYLVALVAWLQGYGPPRRTSSSRQWHLRLSRRDADDGGPPIAALLFLLVLLYAAWTLLSRLGDLPDLQAYPTTAYRWSMFLMGGVTAGVVEEIAFRGYMQSGLERVDRHNALWIASLVFVVAHLTQGIGAVVMLGPGLFIAAMLYGALARGLGTIAPGIVLHVLGDLGRTYWGVLQGDGSLLFVP